MMTRIVENFSHPLTREGRAAVCSIREQDGLKNYIVREQRFDGPEYIKRTTSVVVARRHWKSIIHRLTSHGFEKE